MKKPVYRFLVLISCVATVSLSVTATAGERNVCSDIKTILSASTNQFKEHRFQPKFHPKSTTWQTDLNLLEQSCEIWQRGKDIYGYMCTRSFPSLEAGLEFMGATSGTIQGCFPVELQVKHEKVPQQDGYMTTLQHSQAKSRIDIFLMKNSGLLRDSWTLYLSVRAEK